MKLTISTFLTTLFLVFNGYAYAAAKITITAINSTSTTVSPSAVKLAGAVLPSPASVNAGQSQTYVNTGILNGTSFHLDYANAAGKACHFDAASYNSTTSTSPCIYTKAAQSTGKSAATCTATVTSASLSPADCSFAVKFSIK